jgi:hypothetical protein
MLIQPTGNSNLVVEPVSKNLRGIFEHNDSRRLDTGKVPLWPDFRHRRECLAPGDEGRNHIASLEP